MKLHYYFTQYLMFYVTCVNQGLVMRATTGCTCSMLVCCSERRWAWRKQRDPCSCGRVSTDTSGPWRSPVAATRRPTSYPRTSKPHIVGGGGRTLSLLLELPLILLQNINIKLTQVSVCRMSFPCTEGVTLGVRHHSTHGAGTNPTLLFRVKATIHFIIN